MRISNRWVSPATITYLPLCIWKFTIDHRFCEVFVLFGFQLRASQLLVRKKNRCALSKSCFPLSLLLPNSWQTFPALQCCFVCVLLGAVVAFLLLTLPTSLCKFVTFTSPVVWKDRDFSALPPLSNSSHSASKSPAEEKPNLLVLAPFIHLEKQTWGRVWLVYLLSFLSLSISVWLTLQLPWHPWDWGQNGMNQKILATCIMGSLSSHFLLNSAEPEHARQLGSKWEGNC